MAYRAYRSDRRYRRRRWLLIFVSLLTIIAVVAFLVSRQTEQRGAVEFFGAADESLDLHSKASADLESALGAIGVIERPELTRQLASIVETAQQADILLDLEVPSTIGTSYGPMVTASASWVEGVEAVNETILAIMDGELVLDAQRQLEAALDMLRVGDVAYGVFLESLAESADTVDTTRFGPVYYINPEAQETDLLLYDSQTLVLNIQSSYDLSPHHDVSVSAMTLPEPVGERGGIPVVPFADSLEVQVVVSNVGNEDEATVEVVLEVFSFDTSSTVTQLRTVTDLVAGSSTTVVVDGVDIVPGGLYEAKVTATIVDDIYEENNVWNLTFIWNGES